MKTGFHAKIRCKFPDISYTSETHKNEFQFLNKNGMNGHGGNDVKMLKIYKIIHYTKVLGTYFVQTCR